MDRFEDLVVDQRPPSPAVDEAPGGRTALAAWLAVSLFLLALAGAGLAVLAGAGRLPSWSGM